MSKIPTDAQWAELAGKIKGKQDLLTAGAGISLSSNAVALDYLTLANAFKNWSGTKAMTTSYTSVLSVDVSDIPSGADFFVFSLVTFTGSATLTDTAVRLSYNSTTSDLSHNATTWGRTVVSIWKYTKVASVNSLSVQAKKDNSSTVNATNCTAVVMQAGKWIKDL